jgi:hypothetical protein
LTTDEKTVVEIDGRKITLTNLNKALYPKPKFTKAEVIDYYTRGSIPNGFRRNLGRRQRTLFARQANSSCSLLVGYYERRKLQFLGKVRNGFTPALRRHIAMNFSALETGDCPFDNLPESRNTRRSKALTKAVMKECRWLKPQLVAQVAFTDWTEANHLRHAKFLG